MPAPSRLATRAVLTCGVGLVLAGGVVYGLQAWIGRPSLPSSFWEPRALVDYLDRVSRPHDAIVFTTPEQSGYYELLSRRRLPWRHFTIGAGYLTDDVPVRSQEVLPALGAGRERVWVVLYQSGLPGTEPMREWLARNWWLAGAEWIPDSQVLEYRTSGPAVKPIAPVVFTGDGGAVGLEGLGVPTMAYTSDYLAVSLQWRVIRPTAHAQTVFVHLIGPDGRRYAQRDTQPGGGLWPFDVMEPASVVPDRHALAIPADAPAGDYVLQIGLYAGDQRLASSTGGTAYQVSGITIAGR